MCGVSGIVERGGGPVDPERLEALNAPIVHRGPDGQGSYIDGAVGLAHRRLSILDLSERGAQPMAFGDRYRITYNGEVFNYLELRDELRALGVRFETDTDTEVVVAAYATWGADCLPRFNGMWAFAIHDRQERSIFLARDRYGIKPLYYREDPDRFLFGSELKQLAAAGPDGVARANRGVLIERLLTAFENHTAETFFDGVQALPQGHFGRYDLTSHRLEIRRWYSLAPDPEIGRLSMAEGVRRFRELFEDAVRLRLRSDVRVGTCLSGGLDSSAVSALASAGYDRDERFIGIHAKSIDAEVDESRHARVAAKHLDLDLHLVEPSTQDFVATVDDVVRTQEEPFGSPSMFMGWHVFQRARELGCTVMLNGQGGDEVLLGYERYFVALLRTVSKLRFLREMRAQARNSRFRMRDIAQFYVYFTRADIRIRRLKRRSLLRREIKDAHDFSSVHASAASFRDPGQLQIHEIMSLQLPHLLRYEDRSSMRHSIETRLPFLDYRVVELGVSLKPELKVRDGWTKYSLRKAVEDVLPESITWRRDKIGFQAPDRTWLTSHLPRMREEIAGSRILGEIADRDRLVRDLPSLALWQQWGYFNVAAWERIYEVRW